MYKSHCRQIAENVLTAPLYKTERPQPAGLSQSVTCLTHRFSQGWSCDRQCLFQTCRTFSCLLPKLYRPGRGGGRAGGGARPGGGACGGGGSEPVGEGESGGVGGSAAGAGICSVVGGRARLGGGVYGGGVMELGGGVGGSGGRVEEENGGGLLGVGGRVPCGAGL